MRSPRLAPATIALVVALATGMAACDTGDGKQLRPVDPDSTTTSTVPTSTVPGSAVSGSIETGGLPSVPLDGSTPDVAAAGDAIEDDAGPDGSFQLFTPWNEGDPLDERYTCDGDDVSPPLSWTSPPPGTVQLAFLVTDQSAVSDGDPFVHWALAGVEPSEVSILEGSVPVGAVQATNSFGDVGYGGPCPPEGDPAHLYRVTMYALNQQVELADGAEANELLDYIDMVAIASVDVTATYQR